MYRGRSAAALAVLLGQALFPGCAVSPPESRQAAPPAAEEGAEGEAKRGETSEMVILEASQAAKEKRYDDAVSMLEDLLVTDPENLDALRLLARVHAASGDHDISSRIYEKI